MESPIKYFAGMKDHRISRHRLHELKDIIAITIAAVICGASDWYEVEDYGKKKLGVVGAIFMPCSWHSFS